MLKTSLQGTERVVRERGGCGVDGVVRGEWYLRSAAVDFSAPYVKEAMMKAFREPLHMRARGVRSWHRL
jgi:hypothetical protein